jgi:hypothetical protein
VSYARDLEEKEIQLHEERLKHSEAVELPQAIEKYGAESEEVGLFKKALELQHRLLAVMKTTGAVIRRDQERKALEQECRDKCIHCFHDGFPSRSVIDVDADDMMGDVLHPHGRCGAQEPHLALITKFPVVSCRACQIDHYANEIPPECAYEIRKHSK